MRRRSFDQVKRMLVRRLFLRRYVTPKKVKLEKKHLRDLDLINEKFSYL